MKKLLHDILYTKDQKEFVYKIDDYFITTLIILNVIAVMLETFEDINNQYSLKLYYFELFSVIIFSFEYLIRVWVADLRFPEYSKITSRFKYIFSPMGIIDLFAIIPFYLPFVIAFDGRMARILRLFRLFRIFKLSHYNKSLTLLINVFAEKKQELIVTIVTIFILLIFSSALMFELEHELQPEKFPNIFATFWWAIATLTTIGYGDVFPVSAMGKVLAGLTAVFGIGLVAIPTGLLSAGFLNKISKDDNEIKNCPHCGKDIHNHYAE